MKRREFPVAVKREAAKRSGGTCECNLMSPDIIDHFEGYCTRKACDFDHVIADCLDGEPILENCAHLCREHHLVKTALDRKYLAKRNKHKINRDRPDRKSPKAKMVSRPFNKRLKRKVNGEVVSRDK